MPQRTYKSFEDKQFSPTQGENIFITNFIIQENMADIYNTKTQPQKAFFKEPTKAVIKGLTTYEANNTLIDRIINLEEGQGLIVNTRIMSEDYSDARKFLKHAPEVQTLHDMVRERTSPVELRRAAFDALQHPYYAGYSFRPFQPSRSRDLRRRKVSLVECLEGARIYAYAHQMAGDIEVGQYYNSKAVAKDGATMPVRVPSRRKKKSRYQFDLTSVPIIDNRDKFKISAGVGTMGHDCERKIWHFRYNNSERSDMFVFCAHEIAAYRQAMDDVWMQGKKTPTAMTQFAQPTTLTIDYYQRLLDSVIIEDPMITAKDQLRKLNKAEEEILLWALVQNKGHDETFFRPKQGTKLRDEDWQLRY